MYDSRMDTLEHKMNVENKLQYMIRDLKNRAISHDSSKLESPEKEIFDEYTPKLVESTYGSDEYKSFLIGMGEALKHHYEHNSHHPEHHRNGVKGMTLIDLCEMLADWAAACERHTDGNILASIEYNQKRFGYSDELKQILLNTVDIFI